MQGVLKSRRRSESWTKAQRQRKNKLVFSVSTVPVPAQEVVEPQPWPLASKTICLTPIAAEPREVKILDLIAYSQDLDATRLNLKGGEVLLVRESTAQIDVLVRRVAEQK
jgi:hypothetical protein